MSQDKYFWTPGSGSTVQEYIKKYRPSIITDNETPWIWVKGTGDEREDPEEKTYGGALVEAERILKDLEERMDEIDSDETIPIRAKKGVKSKKAIREEAHEGARESLKNLSKASKWTVGKWLLFPQHDTVDGVWSTIAQSVAEGPLKESGVVLAKVASTPSSPGDGERIVHVVCMYMEDVYDLDVVKKVLVTLLKEHGIEPSAVKSDLYTMAGIDSNHPTKLRSSIWRPNEVIEGGSEAIKTMKEEHRAQRKSAGGTEAKGVKGKVGADGIIESDSEDERLVKRKPPPGTSSEPPLKKAEVGVKVEDGDESPITKKNKTETGTKKTPIKHKPSKALKFKAQDIFAGGSDSE